MPKDLWCSRAVGSWSAPLLGSTAAEDLPRIGRTSIARRSHSCASLQSASCSENFVIRLDVPGQTLNADSSWGMRHSYLVLALASCTFSMPSFGQITSTGTGFAVTFDGVVI